jgi:thymidylate synthase ThyX
MTTETRILADSVNPLTGDRLTTFEITYPNFLSKEILTHRMTARNARSSRAVSNKRYRQDVIDHPFVPIMTTDNKGMVSRGQLTEGKQALAGMVWGIHRAVSLASHATLVALGVHKQHANRLLEVHSYTTMVISSTHWDHFFNLRCAGDAQPEFQCLANIMKLCYEASTPQELHSYNWHLPYVKGDELKLLAPYDLVKLSVARCAAVSYKTFDGTMGAQAAANLYDKLWKDNHLSPFEHVAQARRGTWGCYEGFQSMRYFKENPDYGEF